MTYDRDPDRSGVAQGTGLYNRHLYLHDSGLHLETDVDELLHETLHQHGLPPLDVLDQRLGDCSVVDGVDDFVTDCRGAGIRPENGVDQDLLLIDALVGVNSDDAGDAQVFDEDAV